MKYPVEALLRSPIEIWSASACFLCALVLFFGSPQLHLPSSFSYTVGLVLVVLGITRLAQYLRVLRYQRGLVRARSMVIRSGRIPRRSGLIYLGEGFQWTQKHTQRLKDTQLPESQKYLKTRNASTILARLPVIRARFKQEVEEKTLPPSGRSELHGVDLNHKSVWMNAAERVGHTLVLGTTRVGKTRLAELLITQDIAHGDVVLVFDPKGDVELLKRIYGEAIRTGRAEQFRIFHLGYPQISCRYNAIGRFSRITEVATRIANQLPGSGNSSAFKEFAWRFVNIIARALVALRKVPDYQQIRKYINDIEPLFVEYTRSILSRTAPQGWAKEVKQIEASLNDRRLPSALKGRDSHAIALLQYTRDRDIEDPVLEGLISAYKYDRTYFDKIVSSVGPLMEKLTTGAVADLISPRDDENDERPIFEWLDVIRDGGIVYVGLDSLSDSTVASAVGNSMFADLVSVAGYLYKFGLGGESSVYQPPPKVCIHADEFNELIGDEFIPLLNKAGGAGYQVTAYTQTWSDVEARVGNRAKSGQVMGNFNSLIMLRVKELSTAEILTKQLPKVEVRGLTSASSASDSGGKRGSAEFSSSNADRLSISETPLLNASDIVALPRGQGFALLGGGTLWKLQFPLLSASEPHVDRTLNDIKDELESLYHKNSISNQLDNDNT